jgi:hypothetical protein
MAVVYFLLNQILKTEIYITWRTGFQVKEHLPLVTESPYMGITHIRRYVGK